MERLDGNDEAKDNPIERYVGPEKARLMNTNLFLGSSWIDTQRFKFERRIDTPADFIRQKTVVNANMWTPKQVATTQTYSSAPPGTRTDWGGPFSQAMESRRRIFQTSTHFSGRRC